MASSYAELEDYKWTVENLRCAVVMILVNNRGEISNQTIAGTLGANVRTVQRIRKKLEETWYIDATIQRAQKDEGATRKVRDADFVDKVKKMVDDDPNTSMRTMSRHLNVSEGTVRLYIYMFIRI